MEEEQTEEQRVALHVKIEGTGTVTMPNEPADQQTEEDGEEASPDKE